MTGRWLISRAFLISGLPGMRGEMLAWQYHAALGVISISNCPACTG